MATDEVLASVAAERLGLTKQAIGHWCAKPGAPVRKAGTRTMVRWPDFARWREQELVSAAKRDAPSGSFVERRQAAEARSAEIAAELAELKLARERGESVAIADFGDAVGTILDRLTARLRGLSARFSEFGVEVEATVEKETERIIVELNAWDEDVIDESDDDDPPGQRAA